MPKTVTCMWHNDRGDEAAEFYVSLFPNSKITSGEGIVVEFELDGVPYQILKGGPVDFSFSDAVSIVVPCEGQEEVDHYWFKMIADGGEASRCGWLKDKFGMSWQIVPNELFDYLGDPDPVRAKRALDCMMTQQRIVIDELAAAANG